MFNRLSLQGSRLLLLLLLVSGINLSRARAQGVVNGKVYESVNMVPLEGVSVRNMRSGGGELSDRFGFYSVNVRPGDSIEYYVLGYKRFKFKVPVATGDIAKNVYLTINQFNLPGVEVLARRNVTKDSLNNRLENAALFNYHRPSVAKAILGSVFHPISGLEMLSDMGKNRRLKHFQAHLVDEERDHYIESRFSRQDIEDLTGLKGKELETFMMEYKPSYEFTQNAAQYDMLLYIKEKYAEYVKAKDVTPAGKKAPAGAAASPVSPAPPATMVSPLSPGVKADSTPGPATPAVPGADSSHKIGK